MAKRKDIDVTGNEETAGPLAAPVQATPQAAADPAIEPATAQSEAQSEAQSKPELNSDLPEVESPSISPAVSEPVAIDEPTIAPKPEPEVDAATEAVKSAPVFALVPFAGPSAGQTAEPPNGSMPPRFAFKARHKRYARLAASVAIGAAIGAIVGALATGGIATAPRSNVAALDANKAMQQSLTKLADDVTTLKSKLATATKLAKNQAAAQLKQESAEITGSISAPQTVVAAPLPTPRPAPRIAAAASQPPARLPVVRDWSIRGARAGYVFVEGHGDIYQVVPGAPLPGLGPVQSIRRLDGRWVVTTPRGIIVSMRDRAYFE